MKEEIVAIEWEMFNVLRNIGGRANCQDDWETFKIMRESQFSWYSEKTCELYLVQLRNAKAKGRNLMMEKYGYMMCSTDPLEYAKIKESLPLIDDEKKAMVEALVEIEVGMTEEFYARYPHIFKGARKIHTSEDSLDNTSSETYLRSELYTYAMPTLASYATDVLKMIEEGKNIVEVIVENEVKAYGYKDLKDAEEKLG